MQAAVARIEALADETLPSGIGLHFINEAATLKNTSNEVAITFAIAVFVVLLVLAAQFESILSALVIILTVPFGLAAAVFSLKLTGISINIYSQIGLVMFPWSSRYSRRLPRPRISARRRRRHRSRATW